MKKGLSTHHPKPQDLLLKHKGGGGETKLHRAGANKPMSPSKRGSQPAAWLPQARLRAPAPTSASSSSLTAAVATAGVLPLYCAASSAGWPSWRTCGRKGRRRRGVMVVGGGGEALPLAGNKAYGPCTAKGQRCRPSQRSAISANERWPPWAHPT